MSQTQAGGSRGPCGRIEAMRSVSLGSERGGFEPWVPQEMMLGGWAGSGGHGTPSRHGGGWPRSGVFQGKGCSGTWVRAGWEKPLLRASRERGIP